MRSLCALGALALGATSVLAAVPSAGAADSLGLPGLSRADRYIMAPSSRTVRAARVGEAYPTNGDYVTADSAVSETTGHDLQADPSSGTAHVDGVMVRQAGPGGSFGYRLRVPRGRGMRLRVEEAGSATAHYEVLAGGQVVYERRPDPAQAGTWSNLAGLVHYDVAVPAALIGARGDLRVVFRNAAGPGPGARVHAVWTLGRGATPGGPYGGTVGDPSGALRGGTTTLRAADYGRPYVIYDFGKEVAGRVRLRLRGVTGAPRLGLAFSESPEYLTTASDYSQDPTGLATETHYLAAADGEVVDPVIRGGFRYLMVFLADPGAVRFSGLRVDFTADPSNPSPSRYKGAFLSSDDTLNRLWYSGAYTVQLATIDPKTGRPYPGEAGPVRNDAVVGDGPSVISDGAKRDRMIWGGDNAISAPVSYLTTGQSLPAAGSIAFMAKGQAPSGQIPGLYLTSKFGYNLGWGEYAEWWVHNYWTHYLYTGDRAFLDQWYGAMKKNVAWLESRAAGDGLLDMKGTGGTWGYGDDNKGTYTSSLYVYVLGMAAQAASAMGEHDLAQTYHDQAARTARAINATLWDAAAGAYKVDVSDGAHPQDGNALAVVAGVATGDRAASVLRFFDSQLAGRYGDVTVDRPGTVPRYVSPFVGYQDLLARVSLGDTAGALSLLGRTWTHMLGRSDPGTLWENVSTVGAPQLGSYTSLSHGWSAGPTEFLTGQVLGVTPTSGGFATFSVLPHPAAGLRWAEGRVPTPHGDITAAWKLGNRTFTLRVTAPSGTTATAGVPSGFGVIGAEVRVDGTAVWRDGRALRAGVVLRDGQIQVPGLTGTSTVTARG